jgi:flagellar biosynthesis protein FlhF
VIAQAKSEYGENIKIISYEIENEGIIPFRRKKYTLFIQPPSKKEFDDLVAKEQKDVNLFLERIEKMIDKKIAPLKEVIANKQSSDTVLHVSATGEQVPFEEQFKEFTGDALDLIRLLIKKDVEPRHAKLLVKESCGFDIDTNKFDLNTSFYKEALVNAIKKKIKFKGPLKLKKGSFHVIAFVGPTGVGKTTNLFKIA